MLTAWRAYAGPVPVSVIVTVAIFVLVGLFLRYHRWGREIYAVGGNRAAARAAGIRVDRIRIGVYRRIYGRPALRKYSGSPVGFGDFPSVSRMAGGITQDPPRGYHAIHIIINNGHVTLTGVVDRESDANIASMQANSTPGAFSVDNELMFPSATQKEK